MKKARIINNVAYDVTVGDVNELFHADLASQFTEVPIEIDNGWIFDGANWSAPLVFDPPQVTEQKIVSPVEFMLLFTSQERVSIKAARPTDPVINDFLDLVEDLRLTKVILGSQTIHAVLDYLEASNLITSFRKTEILTG